MARSPLYIVHGPGEVTSRASGLVMDLDEAVRAAGAHLDLAITHPLALQAAAHGNLVADLIAAIREAKALVHAELDAWEAETAERRAPASIARAA